MRYGVKQFHFTDATWEESDEWHIPLEDQCNHWLSEQSNQLEVVSVQHNREAVVYDGTISTHETLTVLYSSSVTIGDFGESVKRYKAAKSAQEAMNPKQESEAL